MENKKLDINKITGTKDRDKQGEILLNTLNAPVVDLIVRYDGRTGKVSVSSIGGRLEIDAIHKLLDMARQELRKQEIEKLSRKEGPKE